MPNNRRLSPSEGYYASAKAEDLPQLIQNASPEDVARYFRLIGQQSSQPQSSGRGAPVKDTSYEDALNAVTLQSLLDSFMPEPPPATSLTPVDPPAKQPDAYTRAIQAVTPETLLRSLTDLIFTPLLNLIASTAQKTQATLQDQIDVGAQLPTPQNPIVQQLSLDSAAAYSTAADLQRIISADPRNDVTRTLTGRTTGPEPSDAAVSAPKSSTGVDRPRIGPGSMQISKTSYTGDEAFSGSGLSPRASHMLASFEGAFPDKKFTVTEADGKITINDVPSAGTAAQVIGSVPSSYKPQDAQKGLAELQSALSRETNPDKRLEMAYSLMANATTFGAAKHQQYINQANGEFNIADLTQALADTRRTDLTNARVRASGTWSLQTANAVEELGKARQDVNRRVSQLMKEDPVISTAMNLASMTIDQIKTQVGLEGKSEVTAMREQRIAQQQAAINLELANPTALNRLSVIKTHQPLPEDGGVSMKALATARATGKMPLSPFEQALLSVPAEDLTKLYMQEKDPIAKARTKEIMIYEEAKLLRGKTNGQPEGGVAMANVNLFGKMMDAARVGDPRVPKEITIALKKALTDAQSIPSKPEQVKAIAIAEENAGLAFVQSEVVRMHSADVNAWKGEIASDPTASAVLKQTAESAPGKSLPLVSFITNYLNYNSGNKKADKITALRRLAASSISAMQESIIFPKVPVSSFVSSVDKQIASRMTRATGWGVPDPMGILGLGD